MSEAKIDGAALPTYPQTSAVLQCAVLPDDRCLVTVSFENFDASGLARAYLVDLGSRRALDEAPLNRFPGSVRAMVVGNVPVMGTYAYQLGFGEGYVMTSTFVDVAAGGADASAAVSPGERVLWTRASGVYDAGNGLIATVFTDNILNGDGGPGGVNLTVRLYDAESVVALFATAPAELNPDALEDFTESLDPVCVCKLSGYQAVNDVAARDDAVYVLASGRLDAGEFQDDASRGGAIVKFDRAGAQTACRALVPVNSIAATYTDLVVGEQGAVAATRIAIGNKGAFEPQETHLFDSSLNAAGSYDFVGNSTGGWVGGHWVALGWDSSRFGHAMGAGAPPADGVFAGEGAVAASGVDGVVAREGEEPGDPHTRVGYAISDALDVAPDSEKPDDSEEPGDSGDPKDPGDTEKPDSEKPDASKDTGGSKDSSKSQGAGALSAGTGDSVPVLPLAIVAVVALAVAIWARRRSRWPTDDQVVY